MNSHSQSNHPRPAEPLPAFSEVNLCEHLQPADRPHSLRLKPPLLVQIVAIPDLMDCRVDI